MSTIGTAGHVDHGKSTLVTALTGIDPDRLAEEKARGMTIDLGFAWLRLPSAREASIVDVPGHEGFIRNMLAGVGGIDVALLVVAADEGVMPQTEEHLAILDLLGVRSGVVALTKCDLVEEDWLELVREEVAERLKPTTLAGIPILSCSAVTRAGLPELLSALDAALDTAPTRRDIGRPRLPIDRVFTITGFGTVATGTLQDGPLHTGQELEALPGGLRARVRGLQARKQRIERAVPGERVAVNLAGVAKEDVRRGDVLALPGTLHATTAVDVRLRVVAEAPRSIPHNAELDVFLGAAEVGARVLLLDAAALLPGEEGWAQLRLRRPIVAARGDRFIVRIPSPSLTVGGGIIAEPRARRHRRRDAAVLDRLAVLARGEPDAVVLAVLRGRRGYGGVAQSEIARVTGLPEAEAASAIAGLEHRGAITRAGTHLYEAAAWERLAGDVVRIVAGYHGQYPLRAGMPREEWRSRLGLGAAEAQEVLAALRSAGRLDEAVSGQATGQRGAFVRIPGYEPRLTPEQEQAIAALLLRFRAEPFAPPARQEADDAIGAEVVAWLVERGTLVKLNDAVLLERAAYDEALGRLLTYLRQHETLTVATARDLLDTSRKYVLALFEHTDEARYTQRRGDDRVLGPSAASSDELPRES